jgi:alanyl-tRNA synthetase
MDINKLEFEAEVVEVSKEKKGWRVILDKTYFFPEGGGQPADKGRINNILVVDVQKEGENIVHFLTENPETGPAKGKIDSRWRRDFMQQHTGQHIISGALWKVGKYKTLSVHMGLDYTTIEIDAPAIPEEDLMKIEALANDVINIDLSLRFSEIHHRELDKFPLRKPTGLKGKIRVVQIGDFDYVACGGLHFESTRHVWLVKAIGIEKIRGNARIAWKIGDRGYADYGEKNRIVSSLKSLLSTKEDMFVQKVKELQEEIIETKRKNNRLENRLAETAARTLYEDRQDRDGSPYRIITESRHQEDGSFMKKVMKELLKRDNVLICLVNVFDEKLQWSIGCSGNINFPFQKIKKKLLASIDGKGGGRLPLWQGTGAKTEQVEDFLAAFRSLVISLVRKP